VRRTRRVPDHLRDCEHVVLTEDVGDPRFLSNRIGETYIPKGQLLTVRHYGETHPTTGRRVLVPINPGTGERRTRAGWTPPH
jgi:hypothetical protein